jgi:hypothetical protein
VEFRDGRLSTGFLDGFFARRPVAGETACATPAVQLGSQVGQAVSPASEYNLEVEAAAAIVSALGMAKSDVAGAPEVSRWLAAGREQMLR